MTSEVISPDLKVVLRRLKLSRMLDTLPERLLLHLTGKPSRLPARTEGPSGPHHAPGVVGSHSQSQVRSRTAERARLLALSGCPCSCGRCRPDNARVHRISMFHTDLLKEICLVHQRTK
jgi:hypothetical protein